MVMVRVCVCVRARAIPTQRFSDLQYLAALDLLLGKMKAAKFPFGQVAAVSGSGQQHGSVYWKVGSSKRLESLDGSAPLHAQLEGMSAQLLACQAKATAGNHANEIDICRCFRHQGQPHLDG
jgi:hypothetical protein